MEGIKQTSKPNPIYGLEISEANKRLWVGEINNGIVVKTLYTDTWGGNRMKGTREQIIEDAELIVKALNVYVEASKLEQLNEDGLPPCPFCGEYPQLFVDPWGAHVLFHSCGLLKITICGHSKETKQGVIDDWSRRVR